MIRPKTICDHCEKEITEPEKVLRVIQTDVYGMNEELHFCSFQHLQAWVREQMEDENTVSVG